MPETGPFTKDITREELDALNRKIRLKAPLALVEEAMAACAAAISWLDPKNEFEYTVREKIAAHRANLDEVRYSLQRESK